MLWSKTLLLGAGLFYLLARLRQQRFVRNIQRGKIKHTP
jgi:hypothetical protein